MSEPTQFPLDSVYRGGVLPVASYIWQGLISLASNDLPLRILWRAVGRAEVSLLVDQSRIAEECLTCSASRFYSSWLWTMGLQSIDSTSFEACFTSSTEV